MIRTKELVLIEETPHIQQQEQQEKSRNQSALVTTASYKQKL